MSDEVDTPIEPVAPVADETQSEQAAPAEESANTPAVVADKEEKLYAGKFKSPEDLEHSYEESQRKLTQLAQEKAELEKMRQQVPDEGYADIPQLDEESAKAVRLLVRQEREQEKIQEIREKTNRFIAEHQQELSDDVLAGTLGRLINKAEGLGQPINHEALLQEAKSMLDARLKPMVKQAQIQTEQDVAKISQDKARMGQIGTTPSSSLVDEESLSADDWAKLHNIPRA
jgi:hypothetical protein